MKLTGATFDTTVDPMVATFTWDGSFLRGMCPVADQRPQR